MTTRIKLKRPTVQNQGTAPTEDQLQENEVAMDPTTGTIYVGGSSTDSGTDCAVLTEKNPANTDSLSEGSSNLYFTNARADARAQLKIDALVDSAPAALDTLNELAAALGDDANFSTTVTNSIATKLALAGGTMTGALTLSGAPTSANHAATKNYVDATVTSGTGSLDTDDITEASNLYYTDARAQAVSINNLVEDTTPQLGGDLDLNGNFIQDGGTDVLEVDGGALKLYHDGDLQLTTGQYEATFEVDVVSTGFFNISNGYSSRILRAGATYEEAALEVGSEGSSVTDAVLDFSLFDGSFGSSDRTATISRLNAYRGANDNNMLIVLVDDDGSQEEAFRFQVDGGNVINTSKGKFQVQDSNGDNMFSVEEDESTKVISGASANSTLDVQHTLDTGDATHTMVRFQTDMTSQANYDHTMGFFAETAGDNISGDEGIVGDFRFQYKANGEHALRFAMERRLNNQQFSKTTIETSFDVTNISNMLKLNPIAKGSAKPSSPSNGDFFFDTDDLQMFIWANGWQGITNAQGMMFTGNDGVLHFYDGSAWKNVLTGASI